MNGGLKVMSWASEVGMGVKFFRFRQNTSQYAPLGTFFVSTHPWTNHVRSDANVKLPVTNEAQM